MNIVDTGEHHRTAMIYSKPILITQRSVVQIHPPQPTFSSTYERPETGALSIFWESLESLTVTSIAPPSEYSRK